jgi:septum formation protein
VLASASPARYGTLRAAGVVPTVQASGVDEAAVVAALDVARPADVALELARRKAHAVAAELAGPVVVVGCDSILDLDGEAHGKPADAAEAASRWRRMRGREGRLVTGHCVVAVRPGAPPREEAAVAATVVRFADLSDAEVDAYVATGEPLRVAGAFTLDGLGGPFVEGVDGDPHNVVGISLPLLRRLLARLGVQWTDLWGGPG